MTVPISRRGMPYAHFQRGAALLEAALTGSAERVPVYAQMHAFAAREQGIPAGDFYRRADLMVPAELETQTSFGLEAPNLTYDVYNIEAEGLGLPLIWNENNPPEINRSRPFIGGEDDLAKIRTPDFETAGRFTMVIEAQSLFHKLTGLVPGLSFCAPFTLAANLYGIARLLLAMYQTPGLAASLIGRLVEEVTVPWIAYQKAHFPEAVVFTGADAAASLPIVNINILQEWVIPALRRTAELSGTTVRVRNWVGESLLKSPAKMLALKSQVGGGAVLGQDPDVDALEPEFYAEFAGQRGLGLILGLGAGFLSQASPEQVFERALRYLRAGMRTRCLALYLCNVDADTPRENLHAAVAAVKEHGQYFENGLR